MLALAPVLVQAAPSEAFWEYMTDFSDESGTVVDPLEYDDLLRLKDEADATAPSAITSQSSVAGDSTRSAAKNTRRAVMQTSSAATQEVKQ